LSAGWLGHEPPNGFAFEDNPVSGLQQSVEHRVGNRDITDPTVPMLHRQL